MHNKFESLARAGYVARGVVYLLLGGLAFTSAMWGGSDANGSSDALSSLLQLPFGRVLLGFVAVGLFGHILWRLAQGLLDADDAGTDIAGVVGRLGSLVSAGANLFLALSAASMALGSVGGGEGGEAHASSWLLRQPFGPWLLGIVALGIVAAGLTQVWKGASSDYRKRLDLPSSAKSMLDAMCRFGLVARGVMVMIIGGLVGWAAWTISPNQAGGISDALDSVHSLPFGRWLYGIAALGLVAFGGYSIVQALYRRVTAPTIADVKQALPG